MFVRMLCWTFFFAMASGVTEISVEWLRRRVVGRMHEPWLDDRPFGTNFVVQRGELWETQGPFFAHTTDSIRALLDVRGVTGACEVRLAPHHAVFLNRYS